MPGAPRAVVEWRGSLLSALGTGVTSGNPTAVLDGDLDEFLQASLAQRVGGADEAART